MMSQFEPPIPWEPSFVPSDDGDGDRSEEDEVMLRSSVLPYQEALLLLITVC